MPLIKGTNGDYLKIAGRSGMEYTDESGLKYFIDSEMVASEDYDIAVYLDSIVDDKSNPVIASNLRNKIVERVKILCTQGEIKIRLFHDN